MYAPPSSSATAAAAAAAAKRKAETPLPPRPAPPAPTAAKPAAKPAAPAATPTATTATGPVAIPPVTAMTAAVSNAMKQSPPPATYPVPEKSFTGTVLPLPIEMKAKHPAKKTAADYSESTSPLLPCPEMNTIAFTLSSHLHKTIITDYWVESLIKDNKLMVVEIVPNPGSAPPTRRTFILMKSRQEFTSPIAEYHEILYFVPGPVQDGKQTKVGACAYLFVTQNSIYAVKFPIKMGAMTMAEYERLNREIDDAGY